MLKILKRKLIIDLKKEKYSESEILLYCKLLNKTFQLILILIAGISASGFIFYFGNILAGTLMIFLAYCFTILCLKVYKIKNYDSLKKLKESRDKRK